MTVEETKKREENEHVKYIKRHLCDCSGEKDFVFVSYKSDDWDVVLSDIVYRLVAEYGLNIYFDGSFDNHNSLWIEQFQKNMEDYKCKGVLAFIDNKYATSYATLLELMYSQTSAVDEEEEGLPVIPITLDKLTKLEGKYGQEDTGLGVSYYEDGVKNINAKTEEEVFAETFEELKRRGLLVSSQNLYKKDKKNLIRRNCSKITGELLAALKVNENYYTKGSSLNGIVSSIRDSCGDGVFSPVGEEKQEQVKIPAGQPKKDKGNSDGGPAQSTISFKDFLKKYNNNNFKKTTFTKLRLIGTGDCAGYTTGFYDSSYELTWDFVMRILEKEGEAYIHFVNGKNPGIKNPPFITREDHKARKARNDSVRYRELELSGLEGYSMNRHYGQYGWIDQVLKKRIQERGLSLNDFSFEYVIGEGEGTLQALDNQEGAPDAAIQGGQTAAPGSGIGETYYYQKAKIFYDTKEREFTILAGSLIKAEPTTFRKDMPGLMEIYNRFKDNGKLAPEGPDYMKVLEDMPTGGSPSAVAKMINGGSINGKTALREINSKRTFKELHDEGENGALL